jgi:hypothetical protein
MADEYTRIPLNRLAEEVAGKILGELGLLGFDEVYITTEKNGKSYLLVRDSTYEKSEEIILRCVARHIHKDG